MAPISNLHLCAFSLIFVIVSLAISLLIFLSILRYKSFDFFRQNLFKKLIKLNLPICIINTRNNNIEFYNENFLTLLEISELNNLNVSMINLFQNFEDYLFIKSRIKQNVCGHLETKIKANGKKVDIAYSQTNIGFDQYIILLFNDFTDILNYVKCLGIFTAIVDNSPDGVVITKYVDHKNFPIINYVNNTISNITGYTKDELLNKPLDVMFNLNVDEETLQMIDKNIHSLKPTSLEYQYIKKTGEICWVQTDIIPVTNENIKTSLLSLNDMYCPMHEKVYGEVELYITIHQKNITESKQYEESAKSLIEYLKETVREKDKINETTIKALSTLIKYDSKDDAINETLKILGTTLNIDRSYVFELKEIGNKQTIQYSYEWVNKDNGISEEINNQLLNNVTFEKLGAFELYINLISNKITKIYSNKNQNIMLNALVSQNIKSCVICPIFNESKLIGFIGLDECTDINRIWSSAIDTMLYGLADAIGKVLTNRK